MGDIVLLKVVVQGHQIKAQFLGDDVDTGTAGQGGVHIHHTGIKAVAGIGGHAALRFQTVEALVPMAEADKVAVRELAALGYASGAGGIEEDEEALWRWFALLQHCSIGGQVARQEDFALVYVDDGAQFFIGNEQLRTGILHHKVQTLCGVAGVERLIGAAGLQHAERGDGHPLTAGNKHRDDILSFETL